MAKKSKSTPKKNQTKANQSGLAWRIMRPLLKWGMTFAVWGVIVVGAIVAWYATDLPDIDKAMNATRKPTITLVARDGSELLRTGDVYGVPVQVGQVPPMLIQAVLATEDRRFHSHFGIDLIGLLRAAYTNFRAGRVVQGGSTITQQLAKNLFLTPARTLKRKVQEVLLSLWLENKLSKDQILTIYLNRVYLGAGTFGIDAASRLYFGRPARKITAYQAAMLAGLLKAPSRYNPHASPKRAAKRTAQVIANMVDAGYISADDATAMHSGQNATFSRKGVTGSRYFADWVLDQASSYVSSGNHDILIETTLDPGLQRIAENRLGKMMAGAASKAGVSQAAAVMMSPDGAVRAMIGGRNYQKSQFNRATQARRQPGSVFKPIVYLAGLEAGLKPTSMVNAAPVTIDGWTPRNFASGKYGTMTMKESLARSINTAAVRVSEKAGRKQVIEVARRLGITGKLTKNPSLALGVNDVSLLEMTAAYSVFANGGAGVWPHGIQTISDGAGKILYARQGSGPGQIVAPGHVAQINNMLAEVIETGTGKSAKIGRPAAGKTGTSQKFRDAWFIGYTDRLVSGIWMGNDNGRPTKNVSGGRLPAKLWQQVMLDAHRGIPTGQLAGVNFTGARQAQNTDASASQTKPGNVKKSADSIENRSFWGDILAIISGDN